MSHAGAERSSKLTPADRAELTELVDRYAAGVDDQNLDALATLFTEDAVFYQPRPPALMQPTDRLDGREAITANFGQLRMLRATQHAIVSRVFSAESPAEAGGGSAEPPDRAEGRIGAIAHHVSGKDAGGGEPAKLTDHAWHLTYLDRYRRVGGTWLIAERTLHLHWVEKRQVAYVVPEV